jgi:hypothetical protein
MPVRSCTELQLLFRGVHVPMFSSTSSLLGAAPSCPKLRPGLPSLAERAQYTSRYATRTTGHPLAWRCMLVLLGLYLVSCEIPVGNLHQAGPALLLLML